jgi:hypothetical protein
MNFPSSRPIRCSRGQGTLVLAVAVEVLQMGQLRSVPVLLAGTGPGRQDHGQDTTGSCQQEPLPR